MQEHVHAADAQHGAVEVVPVEGALVVAPAGGLVPVDGLAVVADQVLGGGDEKTGGAAGRVADAVLRGGRGHLDHEFDDVARGAELAVLAGAGDLAEHVLVEIALGVGVGHVDGVELVHHVGQHPRGRDHEQGVLHMPGVGGIVRIAVAAVPVAAEPLDEGEHLVAHRGEHRLRRGLLEAGPAQVVLAGGEHRLLDRLADAGGLALFQGVQLIQPLDEQQVGELLDDRKGVGDAAGPHGVPDAVDFGFDFTGDHGWLGSLGDGMVCAVCVGCPGIRSRGSAAGRPGAVSEAVTSTSWRTVPASCRIFPPPRGRGGKDGRTGQGGRSWRPRMIVPALERRNDQAIRIIF